MGVFHTEASEYALGAQGEGKGNGSNMASYWRFGQQTIINYLVASWVACLLGCAFASLLASWPLGLGVGLGGLSTKLFFVWGPLQTKIRIKA